MGSPPHLNWYKQNLDFFLKHWIMLKYVFIHIHMYFVYAIGVNYCIDKDNLGNACMRGGTHTV